MSKRVHEGSSDPSNAKIQVVPPRLAGGASSSTVEAASSASGDGGDLHSLYPVLVDQLQAALSGVSGIMARQINDGDDIAIFLGSTRAGKSTLVNYIIGNILECVRDQHTRLLNVISHSKDGPKIGHSALSETVYPSKWVTEKFDEVVWDAPGFGDNRGAVQDISNAFYIKELLTRVNSAKVVLVVDINHISNINIQPFIDLLNAACNILPDIHECKTSVSIIFSKVPQEIDDLPVDKGRIVELLRSNVLDSGVLDAQFNAEKLIELVKYFVSSPDHIGIFRKSKIGEIDIASIDDGIVEAINNATSMDREKLSNVSASLSKDSQLFLYEASDILCEMKELNSILLDIQGYYRSALDDFKTKIGEDGLVAGDLAIQRGMLRGLSERIKDIHENSSVLSLTEMLSKVATCCDAAVLQKIQKVQMDAKLVEFIDQQLGREASREFVTRIDNMIMNLASEMDQIDILISEKTGEINAKQAQDAKDELEAKLAAQNAEYLEQMAKYKADADARDTAMKEELEKHREEFARKMKEQEEKAEADLKKALDAIGAKDAEVSKLKETIDKMSDAEKAANTAMLEKYNDMSENLVYMKAKLDAQNKKGFFEHAGDALGSGFRWIGKNLGFKQDDDDMETATGSSATNTPLGGMVETLGKIAITEVIKGGGSCIVQYVNKFDYDNPLLNHPLLLSQISNKYGVEAASNLIDITYDLAKDSKEELEEALRSDHAMETCSALIGECFIDV